MIRGLLIYAVTVTLIGFGLLAVLMFPIYHFGYRDSEVAGAAAGLVAGGLAVFVGALMARRWEP